MLFFFFCFFWFCRVANGIFRGKEGVLKKEVNISVEEIKLCLALAFVFFVTGILLYKKGGL